MVPKGWKRVPIKDVCESIIDCVNKTAPVVDYETPFKMIRTTNVRNGRVNTEDVRYVTEDTYLQWVRRGKPQVGDIIFTREAPVGEAGVLQDAEGIFLGQRTMMYRADTCLSDNYFLFYSLSSPFCQKQIEDFSNGGTVAHMRVPDCGEILINLPPFLEQKKIAQILSTWDKAISVTEKLLTNSQQQKKALMQQLLTGKKRLLDENGVRFSGEWRNSTLSMFCNIAKGKALSASDLEVGDFPVIAGGKSSPYSHSDYTHENVVTVSASGAYAGYISYHNYKIWASDCSVVSAKADNLIDYFYQLLLSLQDKIYSLQSGGAQPHIYPKDLNSIPLWVPCVKEQQKIAAVLSAADAEISTLEKKLACLRDEKKALMQQLLTGKRRVKVDEAVAE
ncbi:restriction endonuclease subunit S [Escherichia coli]|uniref:restriction endonuclease subunit S n=1 Tax=Escherichia coli TaxID=562 RepID=UPI000BE5F618|nr:restriction endonuclease subunit S [Escherichia coli]EFC2636667.1 restriction endonuclease subunit S [Escherichia coli]EGI4300045.1 restriction endonuclease subunit S [Escherichia coli]EGX8864284.1 restriction endonuclease subunit S [Escherichia coli]EGY1318752.1 restriction endonuclease subunit S [Escherichia coli]EIA0599657.1 restriction endonuclease subunit S [Escherichia coli]